MELLLRMLNPRTLALTAILAGAAVVAAMVHEDILRAYSRWRYPAQGQAGPKGQAILNALDLARERRIKSSAEKLRGMLAAAKQQGFSVDALELRLDMTLKLDRPSTRWRTQELLAEIEMSIPRKPSPITPAAQIAESDQEEEAPKAKPAKKRSRSRRTR